MIEYPEFAQGFGDILTLDRLSETVFEARFPFAWGGSTLAAAVLAAVQSCPEKQLHSLHSWFLRPVDGKTPVRVAVERMRDGRQLTHLRVQLSADGKLLHEMTASFSAPDVAADAIAYQEDALPGDFPRPEQLDSQFVAWRAAGRKDIQEPLEWAVIGSPYAYGDGGRSTRWDAWARPSAPLPTAEGWQAAALAYLSDNHSDWSMAQQVPGYSRSRYSTLDTAIWFHRPPRWDDWLLVRSVSDVAHAGIGIVRRTLYARDGALVATMTQEGLYR